MSECICGARQVQGENLVHSEQCVRITAHIADLEYTAYCFESGYSGIKKLRDCIAEFEAERDSLKAERLELAHEMLNSPGGMSLERQMQWALAVGGDQ